MTYTPHWRHGKVRQLISGFPDSREAGMQVSEPDRGAGMKLHTLTGCLAAVVLHGAAALAAPPADPTGIVTFQVENDGVSTQRGTSDRYYTSGIRLGYTSGTERLPEFLANFGQLIWGDGIQRISIDISQSIFTPRDTQANPPDPRDRPYAGYLRANATLIHDTPEVRSVIGLTLGVVGPSALGKVVQNGFHDIVGDPDTRGWRSQLKDEPAVEVLVGQTYRLPLARLGAFETDALPAFTIGVGTVRDYVQAGVSFRIGQGLGSDFGPARISPGRSGSDAFTPVQPFAWYLFAGADGQGVARDVFLDGSTFRDRSPGVNKKGFFGELHAGLALMAYGVRLSYTHTWQTEQFSRQKSGLFNFGSVALSARF